MATNRSPDEIRKIMDVWATTPDLTSEDLGLIKVLRQNASQFNLIAPTVVTSCRDILQRAIDKARFHGTLNHWPKEPQ